METAAVDVIAEVSLSLRVLIIRNVTKTIACQASTISSVPSDSLLTPTLYNVHNPEHDIQHAFLYYRKQELPSQGLFGEGLIDFARIAFGLEVFVVILSSSCHHLPVDFFRKQKIAIYPFSHELMLSDS